MPDISELGLEPEPIAAVDYNAPEPGSFPPAIKPGRYTFIFNLGPTADSPAADNFDAVEIEVEKGQPKKRFLQINHHATTTLQETNPATNEVENRDVSLNYQRVNVYKHPKMTNSSYGDLVRSLGLHVEGPQTPDSIRNLMLEISGRRSYEAEVYWRMYCQTCGVTVSTAPRKKKGEVAWPKGADGQLLEMAECPQCHQKKYAQPEIGRYKLPSQAAGQ